MGQFPQHQNEHKRLFTKDYENEAAFRRAQILGVCTATLLHFSCVQQFLANTIYSILPTFTRQTLAPVWSVKMGLLQGCFFSIGKMVYAAN